MGDVEGYDIDYRDGYLGHGSYGSVYLARNKENGDIAALKRIIISAQDFSSRLKSVRNEIRFVKELGTKHKNIVKLIKTTEEEDGPRLYVQMLTEYCALRDLEHYSHKYYLTTGHRLRIMCETASGLAFMHGQDPPVIHRDVKPSNILMTEENGQHVVRLADFGLARQLEGSRSVETMTNAGTENYMSPEQFDETNFWFKMRAQFSKSGAQDAYSHGIVSYQLLQSNPFKGLECPEVTKIIIGKMMMRIGEVEAEVDRSRKEWQAKEKERRENMSWLAKKLETNAQIEEKQSEIASKEIRRREDIWKMKNLVQLKDIEPTKSWNPIVINESDSPTVRATKEVIESVVKFDPRERSSMAEVEARLGNIIKDLPVQPGIPVPVDSMTSDAVPHMKKLITHGLPFSASRYYMAISSNGILDRLREDKLVLLSLSESGYSTVWEKPCPSAVRPDSQQFILSDGNIVFRYKEDSPTVIFDGSLSHIITHTEDMYHNYRLGRLCGVVQGDKLLYSRLVSGFGISLDIYDCYSHNHICCLPSKVGRRDGISTATDAATGCFAITDWVGKTLHLFTSNYQLHKKVKLGFLPRSVNGVSCVGGTIAVARDDGWGIVFYNWSGESIHKVSGNDMGLSDVIYGVGNGEEGYIQVCDPDSLHVFSICRNK